MQIEFKEVQKEYLNYPDRKTNLPERKTRGSAGYDFYLKDSCFFSQKEPPQQAINKLRLAKW